MGSPVVSDDGVGLRVVQDLRRRLDDRGDVEIDELGRGGLELMERMVGFRHVVLVDAIKTGAPPGKLHLMTAAGLPTLHASSSHDVNLPMALELGRRLGYTLPLPGDIDVVGVEAADVETLSEQLTPDVEAAVPGAVEIVLGLL